MLRLLHAVVHRILSRHRGRLHHHLATVARSEWIHWDLHATITGMHGHPLLLLRVAADMHRISRLRGGEPVRREPIARVRLHLLGTRDSHAADATGASAGVVPG